MTRPTGQRCVLDKGITDQPTNGRTNKPSYRDARTHLNIFQEKLCNDLAEITISFLAQKFPSLLALNLVFTPTDGRMDGQMDGEMDGWMNR